MFLNYHCSPLRPCANYKICVSVSSFEKHASGCYNNEVFFVDCLKNT